MQGKGPEEMYLCPLGLLILQPTPTYLIHQGVLKLSPLNPVSECRKIRGKEFLV
jgi:hypothetical protein